MEFDESDVPQRPRHRVRATKQSLTCSTLALKYTLSGHSKAIEAACYNSKRHHILTSDSVTLRLWSLRKELCVRRRCNIRSDGSSGAAALGLLSRR